MITLVVAEKPSVGRDLARLLGATLRADGHLRGPSLWVTWCIGHLAELAPPEAYDPALRRWQRATLPMLPPAFRLQPSAHARDQLAVVRRLLADREVGEVVNACDAGREGELIFAYLYELAGARQKVTRLWLAALTDAAVRRAWATRQPGSAYAALAAAARCRSEADWLVGLNATRALTLRQRAGGGKGPLCPVGRVQTPTLALLVAREAAREAFVPEAYWTVEATLASRAHPGDAARSAPYRGTYVSGEEPRLKASAAAEAVAAAVAERAGKVVAARREQVREPPPLLFDLTQLQRRANMRHRLSAADTLAAAQALYERHKLITYPRTDSQYLPTALVPELPGRLRALAVAPWAPFVAAILAAGGPRPHARVVADAEVGDHHAIIPTGRPVRLEGLSPAERQIFDLVARRTLAAFSPPATFAQARLTTEVAGHRFLSRGRTCLDPGWQAVEPPLVPAGTPPLLPPLDVGDAVHVTGTAVHRGETRPPPLYSDASLLSAMERAGDDLAAAELRRAMKERGLGTPATRAAIIEGLLRRGLVAREARALRPTPAGRDLIAALPCAALKSASLTGSWEAKLAQVAHGTLSRPTFMAEVRELTRSVVAEIFAAPARHVPPPPSSRPAAPSRTSTPPSAPPRMGAPRPPETPVGAARTSTPPGAPPRIAAPRPREPPLGAARTTPARAGGQKGASPRATSSRRTGTRTTASPRPAARAMTPMCPRCGRAPVIRGRQAWGCGGWREGCRWTLPLAVAGVPLTEAQMRALVTRGRTRPIAARGGQRLVLGDDGAPRQAADL